MANWATSVAPVITSVGSLSGVAAALYVSVKTRKEVRTDRMIRMLPILAFDSGGYRSPIQRSEFGHRIGGISPEYIEETFKSIPADALVNQLPQDQATWGTRLVNHGQGTAFNVRVTWVAHKVTLKTETFAIDSQKASEPKYGPECNTMPSRPSHVTPSATADLTRIPTFVVLDPEAQLKSIKGEVHITYSDALGNAWETIQDVYLEVGYDIDPPYFHCTFLAARKLPSFQ